MTTGRGMNDLAARSLQQQASPFGQAGCSVETGDHALEVRAPGVTLALQYRTQRYLFARIHQLRAVAEIMADGPDEPCELRLEVRNRRHGTFRWSGAPGAAGVIHALNHEPCAQATSDLVSSVDLVECSLHWFPHSKTWQVRIEPYAGSQVRLLLPPLHYISTLTAAEAGIVVRIARAVSTALRSTPERSTT
ncbi:hypothetical protein GCM10009854_48470 [Saccharopolyspora halophila]|uniref:DUF3156 family protein n=1 Tax=Saccharopolyspora halophila TaxID=405551 RepID=A0ABN3GWU7_9PSEU